MLSTCINIILIKQIYMLYNCSSLFYFPFLLFLTSGITFFSGFLTTFKGVQCNPHNPLLPPPMTCMYIIHVHINIYLYYIQEKYVWKGYRTNQKKKKKSDKPTSSHGVQIQIGFEVPKMTKTMSVTVPSDDQADQAVTVCSCGDLICHSSCYFIFLVSLYLYLVPLIVTSKRCVVSQSEDQLTSHAQ